MCPMGRGFVTWGDSRGLRLSNPVCDCGNASRENLIGVNKKSKCGRRFFVCAAGICDYYEES